MQCGKTVFAAAGLRKSALQTGQSCRSGAEVFASVTNDSANSGHLNIGEKGT